MQVKRILVPVDGSELTERAIEASIALAEYFNVSLDYLVGLSDSPKRA